MKKHISYHFLALVAILLVFGATFLSVVSSIAWLPVFLLCGEKIVKRNDQRKHITYNIKQMLINLVWPTVFVFSLSSSFLAGHLQVFFYVFLTTAAYIMAKILKVSADKRKVILLFVICFMLFGA